MKLTIVDIKNDFCLFLVKREVLQVQNYLRVYLKFKRNPLELFIKYSLLSYKLPHQVKDVHLKKRGNYSYFFLKGN